MPMKEMSAGSTECPFVVVSATATAGPVSASPPTSESSAAILTTRLMACAPLWRDRKGDLEDLALRRPDEDLRAEVGTRVTRLPRPIAQGERRPRVPGGEVELLDPPRRAVPRRHVELVEGDRRLRAPDGHPVAQPPHPRIPGL